MNLLEKLSVAGYWLSYLDGATMLTCDRQHFIDCVNGDLLIRNENGVITHLGDAATHAVEAAERGEVVALTVAGQIVSRIIDRVELPVYGWTESPDLPYIWPV